MISLKSEETIVFNVNDLENFMIKEVLTYTEKALSEKGYNSINQIVGYLTSGDLAYISSYKDARKKMANLDREKIIEALLKNYLSEK